MTISPVKALDQLEKQVDGLVKELERAKKTKEKLDNNIKEIEVKLSGRESEISRLKKKANAVSGDLDEKYLKQRTKIHNRLTQLLARLDSL